MDFDLGNLITGLISGGGSGLLASIFKKEAELKSISATLSSVSDKVTDISKRLSVLEVTRDVSAAVTEERSKLEKAQEATNNATLDRIAAEVVSVEARVHKLEIEHAEIRTRIESVVSEATNGWNAAQDILRRIEGLLQHKV